VPDPVELTVLSWNLLHGRDAPPDQRLDTWRSRLLRVTEDDGAYLQVNRSLEREFTSMVGDATWDLCLLQEVPPAWAWSLERRSGAQSLVTLTSRNELALLTRPLARCNPDLLRSWEGGSNVVLVRPPWAIAPGSGRSLLLSPLRERGLRERRLMSFVDLFHDGGASAGQGRPLALSAANLHADSGPRAERELRRAAERAVAWAGDRPLVFGGDFNARPRSAPIFETLERALDLHGATAPDAIDHLLGRRLEIAGPARAWPPERREIEVAWKGASRRIRLSDHAPVEATFRLPGTPAPRS
jgi:endonuclease/exonuclease/phosphatase family metal-dependent hydrolase